MTLLFLKTTLYFTRGKEKVSKCQKSQNIMTIILPPKSSLTVVFCKKGVLTAQKIKFSIKNFFSKRDQIHRKLRIRSQLLKKSLMENFIFCAVS